MTNPNIINEIAAAIEKALTIHESPQGIGDTEIIFLAVDCAERIEKL